MTEWHEIYQLECDVLVGMESVKFLTFEVVWFNPALFYSIIFHPDQTQVLHTMKMIYMRNIIRYPIGIIQACSSRISYDQSTLGMLLYIHDS